MHLLLGLHAKRAGAHDRSMTRLHACIFCLAAAIVLHSRVSAIIQPPHTPAAVHGIDVAGMDRSTDPGDDFFAFANGAWFKRTEIPPDRSSAGIWNDLADEASRNTRDLLDGLLRPDATVSGDAEKVRDYYASFIDERTIEGKGLAPLGGLLAGVAAISDRPALTQWVCGNLRADVDPLNATNFYTDRPVRPVVLAGPERPGSQRALPAAGRPRHARSRLLPSTPPQRWRRCGRATRRTSLRC